MIVYTFIGFTLGLYAGKRRANGKGWGEIFSEMFRGILSAAKSIWSRIREQFKKDDPAVPR